MKNSPSSSFHIRGWTTAVLTAWLLLISGCQSSNEPAKPVPAPPISDASIPEPNWGPGEHAARQHAEELHDRLNRVRSSASPDDRRLAEAYGKLGMVYLTYDLQRSALPCLSNAGRHDQKNFRWPYLEAFADYGLTDTAAAAEAMEEAVRRIRQNRATDSEHLIAALCFLGEASIRLNRIDAAREQLDEVLAMAPETRFALFKRGQLAALEGDSEQALRYFLKAWSLSVKPPPALAMAISGEYRKLGRDAEAGNYRVVMEPGGKEAAITFPNPLLAEVRALNRRPATFRVRAESTLSGGQPEHALALLSEGLKYSPDAYDLRALRGEILFAMNRSEAAINDLEAVPDAVRSDTARSMLIQACAGSSETRGKALEYAHAWRNQQPESGKPHMALGALQFQLGRYREAQENFASAVRLVPEEAAPRLGESIALCASGEYGSARERLIQARADFPDHAEVKHQLARFLATCPEAPLRDADQSLALLRDFPVDQISVSQRETLVCALMAQGDFAAAQRQLTELSADPQFREQPLLQHRATRIREALASNRAWTERWPFAEIQEPR